MTYTIIMVMPFLSCMLAIVASSASSVSATAASMEDSSAFSASGADSQRNHVALAPLESAAEAMVADTDASTATRVEAASVHVAPLSERVLMAESVEQSRTPPSGIIMCLIVSRCLFVTRTPSVL